MLFYRRTFKCTTSLMIIEVIIFASGNNVTTVPYVNLYYNYSKKPQIFQSLSCIRLNTLLEYSSLLSKYKYPSIIYCFKVTRPTVFETYMWTKYVPIDIWGLVCLCLLLLSVLYTASGPPRKSVK